MAGAILMLLGASIILYCSWVALRPGNLKLNRGGPHVLADRFPGPVTIGVSIRKYLFLFAIGCAFVAGAIAIIRSSETLAASLASHHGPVRGRIFLHLLIILHLARNMAQAIAILGWVGLTLFGAGALFIILKLILSVWGSCGLTLDGDGFTSGAFTVRGKRNQRFRWLDIGDFDSLELSDTARKRYQVTRCVIFNHYQAPESPIEWLRLTGRNRALVEAYQYPADDIAVLMSVWRRRALEASRDNLRRDRGETDVLATQADVWK
jgi:hypothetical protein